MKIYALFHTTRDEDRVWDSFNLVGLYSSKKNAKKHEKAIAEMWKSERYNIGLRYSSENKTKIEIYDLDSSDERYLSLEPL